MSNEEGAEMSAPSFFVCSVKKVFAGKGLAAPRGVCGAGKEGFRVGGVGYDRISRIRACHPRILLLRLPAKRGNGDCLSVAVSVFP